MPVTKPSSLPRWASTTPGNIADPPSGTKDTGYVPDTQPPAQWFNWLFNLIYQWIQWINDLANQAFTWTAAHTFQSGITVSGGNPAVQGTATTGSAGIGIKGVGDGAGTGVRGSSGTGGIGVLGIAPTSGIAIRASAVDEYGLYAEATGSGYAIYGRNPGSSYALWLTKTASPSGPNHTAYIDGYSGSPGAGKGPLCIEQLFACPSGWADREPALVIVNGTILLPDSQPSVSEDVGYNNVLHAGLVPKAWALVSIGNNTTTVHGGNNVASVIIDPAFQFALVTFVRAMADVNYTVTTGIESVADNPVAKVKTLTGFQLWNYQGAGIGASNWDLAGGHVGKISFTVMGQQ